MPELQRVRMEHAAAVLAFELENRAYFAASISDRGDGFFGRFAEGFEDGLAQQAAGRHVLYVLVDEDGSVLGRFNLYDLEDGTADLGYRVAERAAGRGVATSTVREVCRLAAEGGLHTLRAAASLENVASERVLVKAGFVLVGPADPSKLGGERGSQYERRLASASGGAI